MDKSFDFFCSLRGAGNCVIARLWSAQRTRGYSTYLALSQAINTIKLRVSASGHVQKQKSDKTENCRLVVAGYKSKCCHTQTKTNASHVLHRFVLSPFQPFYICNISNLVQDQDKTSPDFRSLSVGLKPHFTNS